MRIILQGGDNMLGRAVQLTLPYQTPGAEDITDSQRAQDYLDDILPNVDISTIRNQNYDGTYLWGNLPFDLQENVRIINLEAAPTLTINNPDIPKKSIHYHINVNNLPHVFAKFARPYVISLANNHSMDMGHTTFVNETLPIVQNSVGAGMNLTAATTPRIIGNIAIFAFGAGCAGIPQDWQASTHEPGIAYLPPITSYQNVELAFKSIYTAIQAANVIDKCIVITIHWGPNWATVNDGQEYREWLAHRLIDDANVSLIHGHSSHHIRGIEIYKNKLIIYGAGDFINDYEAIYSSYNTASALYVVDIDDTNYTLTSLILIPFKTQKLQCMALTNDVQIDALLAFVNRQSLRDTATPLLLHRYDHKFYAI